MLWGRGGRSVFSLSEFIAQFEEYHSCEEFYNQCHAEHDGRFCTGEHSNGSSSSGMGAYFTSNKGRTIAPGQRVMIYRNLHKEGVVYSVRDAKSGLVLGHSPSILLHNATYDVHEAGRQRVIKEKRKNVHSFVVGEYQGPFSAADRKGILEHPDREPVSYNPYKMGAYYSKKDERPLAGAQKVIVDQTGVYQLGGKNK